MSLEQSEIKNCDVPYSIRLPQDLLEEITRRAVLEGVKPSTWIRNSLQKLIQDKDEEKAGNIKSAVMYLLTSDPDVQKQIQQITGGTRRKGEVSKVEEYAALNNQSEALQEKINRNILDINEFEKTRLTLENEINTLEKNIGLLHSAFDTDAEQGKLKFILQEYQEKLIDKQKNLERITSRLETKRRLLESHKALQSRITMRKERIISSDNHELFNTRKKIEDLKNELTDEY